MRKCHPSRYIPILICFRSHLDEEHDDILQALELSLVEFQTPLFCCLAISPILLFRTCLLQSSRFGRHFYLSVSLKPSIYAIHSCSCIKQFMMCVGDTKPAPLRKIEALIWKNLYLVARCRMTPAELMNTVLDSIVEPTVLEGFHMDKIKFRDYFKSRFDSIENHKSYFFPGNVNDLFSFEPTNPHGSRIGRDHQARRANTYWLDTKWFAYSGISKQPVTNAFSNSLSL